MSQRIKQIEDQKPDEEVIEERRLEIQVKVKEKKEESGNDEDNGSVEEGDGDPLGIANLKDDTTNTWHHHYQVSQHQRASNRRIAANREQFRTVASKGEQ